MEKCYTLFIKRQKEECKVYTTSIAIQVLPDVSDIKKVCEIVDEVIAYIKSTGCHYEVGPFETVVEGEFDALMNIIKRCQEIPIEQGAPSTKAYVKIFHNPAGVLTISEKIDKYRE
ncbi:MAG: thiamine-binding protein [Anaerotignum sp.]|nr:thiamine-binding protein [Anaerotignum sp.]MBQ7084290.1 thiamine-binding protein [Anaerotignum sp.]MBR3909674.1 thiamine-binding protein [Anaerotignum sp.]MBR6652288.1 thiamine-binding protein [Anaerotignum sp.]